MEIDGYGWGRVERRVERGREGWREMEVDEEKDGEM